MSTTTKPTERTLCVVAADTDDYEDCFPLMRVRPKWQARPIVLAKRIRYAARHNEATTVVMVGFSTSALDEVKVHLPPELQCNIRATDSELGDP
jgi:hypothetical protein